MDIRNSQIPRDPLPLEVTDPVLGEMIRQVAHKEHPTVKTAYFSPVGYRLWLKSGQMKSTTTRDRNDPCW